MTNPYSPPPSEPRNTAEYRATGQTRNQELHRMGATKAVSSDPMAQRADRFSAGFLQEHPGAETMASGVMAQLRGVPSAPQSEPAYRKFASLGSQGVVEVYDRLRSSAHGLSADEAARLEQLMGGLRGQ